MVDNLPLLSPDELAALARLGVEAASPHGQRDLGQLGRLARTGLAADDDDRVFADRARNVLAPRDDGQVFGVLRPRQIAQSVFEFFGGAGFQRRCRVKGAAKRVC